MSDYGMSSTVKPIAPATQVMDQLEQRVTANEATIAKIAEQLKPLYMEGPLPPGTEGCPDQKFPPLAPLLSRALSLSDRLADSTRRLSQISDMLQV